MWKTKALEVSVCNGDLYMYTLYYCFNSTIKQGCNASVKLVVSQDKRHLEVTYVSETHNHMMNKVIVLC